MIDRQRFHEILRTLPVAIVLYLLSRVFFDLLSGKPQFWTSEEAFLLLLWNPCFAIPFIVFGLLVAAHRNSPGNKT